MRAGAVIRWNTVCVDDVFQALIYEQSLHIASLSHVLMIYSRHYMYSLSFDDIFQALYEQSLHIKSAIPHPLIMGVIRGKSLAHKLIVKSMKKNNVMYAL